MTEYGDFLFSQAVKDHFDLPITLPDENNEAVFPLYKILQKLARKDIPLTIEVWAWCVKNFLPYVQYAPRYQCELTNDALDLCYELSDKTFCRK